MSTATMTRPTRRTRRKQAPEPVRRGPYVTQSRRAEVSRRLRRMIREAAAETGLTTEQVTDLIRNEVVDD